MPKASRRSWKPRRCKTLLIFSSLSTNHRQILSARWSWSSLFRFTLGLGGKARVGKSHNNKPVWGGRWIGSAGCASASRTSTPRNCFLSFWSWALACRQLRQQPLGAGTVGKLRHGIRWRQWLRRGWRWDVGGGEEEVMSLLVLLKAGNGLLREKELLFAGKWGSASPTCCLSPLWFLRPKKTPQH